MELSYQKFLQYYRTQDFERGLQNYFKVTESEDGYRIILHMDRHFNGNVTTPHYSLLEEDGSEKSIYFAFIFYYVLLCNNTIKEVAGMDALINFLKSTNWPLTSCGLGGIMSPNQMLVESDLVYPDDSTNCQKALAVFRETIPFMKEELNNFFKGDADNLNQAAYDEFAKVMDGKIEKFWEIADKEIESFTFHK